MTTTTITTNYKYNGQDIMGPYVQGYKSTAPRAGTNAPYPNIPTLPAFTSTVDETPTGRFLGNFKVTNTDISTYCIAKFYEATSPGAWVVTPPSWANSMRVVLMGGGGGGAYGYKQLVSPFATLANSGRHGGFVYIVTSPSTVSMQIAAGGPSSTQNQGTLGAPSTITIAGTTYSAAGGGQNKLTFAGGIVIYSNTQSLRTEPITNLVFNYGSGVLGTADTVTPGLVGTNGYCRIYFA
jgi:hypothetical protein